jgi:L-histidine N-alpha-methyltransferase
MTLPRREKSTKEKNSTATTDESDPLPHGLIPRFKESKRKGIHDILDVKPEGKTNAFAHSVVAGLAHPNPTLDCQYLYDERGSRLFEEITRQPEYYLTRTEAAILDRHAEDIQKRVDTSNLLELGSGSSVKTDRLLDVWVSGNGSGQTTYIPVDVSESALSEAAERIRSRFPTVQVIGINGAYENGLALLAETQPVMGIFLGSSIGNFTEEDEESFLRVMSKKLRPNGRFLLGVDLVKDAAVLEAAYDDRAGVTRQFTLNMFERMNRELGSDIDTNTIEHVAEYSEERERVEIVARFHRRQQIDVKPLGQTLTIDEGKDVLVEISRKFRLDDLTARLNGLGLDVDAVFTDDREWFALLMLRPNHG